MAKQTTFLIQVPFTAPSGNILTPWTSVAGYSRLSYQYYVTGMGFSGNIEILTTIADENGRPYEPAQYIISGTSGAFSGTWTGWSGSSPPPLCNQFIRYRVNISLGIGSATAVMVTTVQE